MAGTTVFLRVDAVAETIAAVAVLGNRWSSAREVCALRNPRIRDFRHFIPAYMIWVLRHPDGAEAVVDSTVWAFLPELHGEGLAEFVRSKPSALNVEQRAAVAAFLRAMIAHHEDAEAALGSWLDSDG